MIQPTEKDIGRAVKLRIYNDHVGVTVPAKIIGFDRMGIDILIDGRAIPIRKNQVDLSWAEGAAA